MLFFSTINVWSNDGDIFTAKTVEGVDMAFKVISELDKTCQVGRCDGEWFSDHAIPTDYEGNITIPTFVNGYHVIRIGRAAFDHCQMKSIYIPSDIKTIYREAFNNCTGLSTITLPYGLSTIGGLAFNYCTNLSIIKSEIEKPFKIEDDVFRGISSNAILQVPRGTSELYRNNTSWSKNFTEIEEYIIRMTNEDVNYTVVSNNQRTINLAKGEYEQSLTIPATITEEGYEWKIVGLDEDAFNSCVNLSSIIWNPDVVFNGNPSNPNLLLYVKDKEFAGDYNNYIANGEADAIYLTDAEGGNNFYCPQAFTARNVTYEHNYSMKSGLKVCQGWETIALPFDVATISRESGEALVPYASWSVGSAQRPFWLYSLTSDGWKAESSIKANTPYIICMPNNDFYDAAYNISGKVVFKASNVQIAASDNLPYGQQGNKKLIPNYQNQDSSSNIWALNVNNEYSKNTDSSLEGSMFVNSLRSVRPFEAYMTIEGSGAARRAIPIFDEGETTGIINIPLQQDINNDAWYTIEGRKLQNEPTSKGVYIRNGKKVIVK